MDENKEVEHKASFDEEGKVVLKKKSEIKKGKKSRSAGSRFELKVRKYWESKGYIVDKWSNNVDLENKKLISAKRKYNPFKKVMAIGTGFPDFIVIQFIREGVYDIIGVEVKINGILSKEEKEKCRWYLEKRIFSKILIAKKSGKAEGIEHINFSDKWR
ncbi:hypothetical protein J4477_03360 [Candidatus Pacearchaeota archaeon]|nr:hypothetical protein [Candidatus Pacearchaeota archaeon]